ERHAAFVCDERARSESDAGAQRPGQPEPGRLAALAARSAARRSARSVREGAANDRSEERRVGKECRDRWAAGQCKKKGEANDSGEDDAKRYHEHDALRT